MNFLPGFPSFCLQIFGDFSFVKLKRTGVICTYFSGGTLENLIEIKGGELKPGVLMHEKRKLTKKKANNHFNTFFSSQETH